MMKRREFITLIGGAAATWPLPAQAQQPERLRRIALLSGGAETDPEQAARLAAFQQALRALGWIEGRNISIDSRYAGGEAARMHSLAREMVEQRPEVLVASTTPVVAAFRQITSAIPIVFVVVSDPVGSGFVADLARPGGNITGFINIESSLSGKWVELLKEIAPHVNRVAMMFNPETAPQYHYYLPVFETATRSFALQSSTIRVRSQAEIEQSIADLGREPGGGLVVMSDIFVSVHRKAIITQAGRFRVPAVYPFRFFVTEGGLISYGVDLVDSFTRAASYVHRILMGEKPADLPVQVPTKFELAINLKTAKELGLTVPPMLLARADEVIE